MNPASSWGTKDVRTRRGRPDDSPEEVLTCPIEGLRHSTEGLGEAASIELPVEGVDPAIWTILEPWLHHHGTTVGVRDHITDLHPRREREVQCDPFPGRLNRCHSIGVRVMLVEIHGPILPNRALAGLRDHQRTGVHVPRANALDPSDGTGDRGFTTSPARIASKSSIIPSVKARKESVRCVSYPRTIVASDGRSPSRRSVSSRHGRRRPRELLELQHGAISCVPLGQHPSRTR